MTEPLTAPTLPAVVHRFLDGTDLDGKVGPVVQLSTVDGSGWVRQAMLSPGEVLAISDTELRLLLYATSRTTAALTASGQGLLTVVLEEQTHKVQVVAERLTDHGADGRSQALFRAVVAAAEVDSVGYARVLHGIEYELSDQERALGRWRQQIELMRSTLP